MRHSEQSYEVVTEISIAVSKGRGSEEWEGVAEQAQASVEGDGKVPESVVVLGAREWGCACATKRAPYNG